MQDFFEREIELVGRTGIADHGFGRVEVLEGERVHERVVVGGRVGVVLVGEHEDGCVGGNHRGQHRGFVGYAVFIVVEILSHNSGRVFELGIAHRWCGEQVHTHNVDVALKVVCRYRGRAGLGPGGVLGHDLEKQRSQQEDGEYPGLKQVRTRG